MIDEFISDVMTACRAPAGPDRSALAALLARQGSEGFENGDRIEPLTSQIYRAYHCRSPEDGDSGPVHERPETSLLLIEEDVKSAFDGRLEAMTYLEPGFSQIDPTGSWPRRFTRNGLVLRCLEEEVRPGSDGSYSLSFPRCLPYRSRGFLSFVGKSGPLAADTRTLRIYLAVEFEGALAAMGDFCRHADDLGLRYLVKVLGRKSDYVRTDNMVAYIDHKDFRKLRPALADIARQNEDRFVHERLSIFCKPIARGISIAEEPAAGDRRESFGLHRSRLLAESVLRFLDNGGVRDRDRLAAAVRTRFSEDDVSVKLPYLSYSWADDYD